MEAGAGVVQHSSLSDDGGKVRPDRAVIVSEINYQSARTRRCSTLTIESQ